MKSAWTAPAVCAIASASLALTSILPAQPGDPASNQTDPAAAARVVDSIRYLDRPDGRSELQTSVISLRNGSGNQVDLVSAVHIGDATYFEGLNRLLAGYDVVLYELVGGPVEKRDEQPPSAELSSTRLLQSIVKSMLGLRYQLDGIDYQRPNFVHADATWEDWDRLQAEREENLTTLFAKAMAMQNDPELQKEMEKMKTGDIFTQILSAVQEFNPDKFKRSLAPMLSEAEGFVTKLEGKEGSVIISERNKIVMDHVREQVAKGHRKIAVFYGAGHMPDLQARLEKEGFAEAGISWVTAWEIGNSASSVTGLDLLENVLKDDAVVENVISIFRTFAGENLARPSN